MYKRQGVAVGQQSIGDTKRAGLMGMLVAFSITLPISVFTIINPDMIARVFFDDQEMIVMTQKIIFFIGFLFIFDTLMAVSLGALRGTGDVWTPFFILSICFWIFGIPLSYIFAITLNFGLIGLWIGIGVGIISSLLLLGPRFYIISSRSIQRL